MNQKLLLLFGFILTLMNCSPKSIHQSKSTQPNILIIHIDDLGYHDLSVNGSKIYQTPNIDQLAAESVVFDNAYANYPRCVPSRYAMMKSGYPIQNGDVSKPIFCKLFLLPRCHLPK